MGSRRVHVQKVGRSIASSFLRARRAARRRDSKGEGDNLTVAKWEDADTLGECPYCGKYRPIIFRGEVKPCFMWERVEEDDGDDGSSEEGEE